MTTQAELLETLSITRIERGAHRVVVGGHRFLVVRGGAQWFAYGDDNRTEEMVRAGVYAGTTYCVAQGIADALPLSTTLGAVQQNIIRHLAD